MSSPSGVGAWLFGQIPAEGNLAPILTVFFTTLAILPIGLTRLPNPPPPGKVSVDVPLVWRNSPVAFVGVLAAGGLSMAVQGFTPIYAAANSVAQGDVALLMLVMQFGLIFIQYPMGVLSDRIDRRIVLILVCILIALAGVVSLFVSFANLILLMLVFAVFAGAVETVYSIANAHANDRTAPTDFVPLASTLLMCWSIAATIVPLSITLLTPGLRAEDLHLRRHGNGARLCRLRCRQAQVPRNGAAAPAGEFRDEERADAECRRPDGRGAAGRSATGLNPKL